MKEYERVPRIKMVCWTLLSVLADSDLLEHAVCVQADNSGNDSQSTGVSEWM